MGLEVFQFSSRLKNLILIIVHEVIIMKTKHTEEEMPYVLTYENFLKM